MPVPDSRVVFHHRGLGKVQIFIRARPYIAAPLIPRQRTVIRIRLVHVVFRVVPVLQYPRAIHERVPQHFALLVLRPHYLTFAYQHLLHHRGYRFTQRRVPLKEHRGVLEVQRRHHLTDVHQHPVDSDPVLILHRTVIVPPVELPQPLPAQLVFLTRLICPRDARFPYPEFVFTYCGGKFHQLYAIAETRMAVDSSITRSWPIHV